MSKTLYFSGIIALVALVVMRGTPYFEGVDFTDFWLIPMGVLPVGLIAFIIFVITAIVCAIRIIKKKKNLNNLYIIAFFPVLIIGLYVAPFPSYIDGMKKTIVGSASRQQLMAFAVDAKSRNIKRDNYEENERIIKELKTKYPKLLSIGIRPRIEVTKNYVTVFYGSALVKHWGYVIGDVKKFPIKHIPKDMYKKVYKGVWVYHDIY